MFPMEVARSSTILGSGVTQGATSRCSTAFTNLENSMALGVMTARVYPGEDRRVREGQSESERQIKPCNKLGLVARCHRPSASTTMGIFLDLAFSMMMLILPSMLWFLPRPGPRTTQCSLGSHWSISSIPYSVSGMALSD